MSKEEKKDFTFINEHIRSKPFYKKKWVVKTGTAVGLAVIFGAVAGAAFAVVTPWAQGLFGEPQKPTQIVIAQETENVSESNSKQSQTDTRKTEEDTQKATQKQAESEAAGQTNGEGEESLEEKGSLSLRDYKRLYTEMRTVANRALKSIVTVTGSSSQIDWFYEESENHVEASGMIVADNGVNMYILTEMPAIENAERIRVTFPNETVVDAVCQRVDITTGLAIVRIPSAKVDQETRQLIDINAFCNASSVAKGTPVIALGSPLGSWDAMAFGMVTAIESASLDDREYSEIQTDIINSAEGSGILVNLDGKIVGFITENSSSTELGYTITAVSAPEIVQLVEDMTNNKSLAYMGIVGKEVTQNVMEESKIPRGVYIKEVTQDSPAMYAGIQTGDVMTALEDAPVFNMKEYMEQIRKQKPGQVVTVTLKRLGVDGLYSEIKVPVTLGGAA